jgi:hypothetical protein
MLTNPELSTQIISVIFKEAKWCYSIVSGLIPQGSLSIATPVSLYSPLQMVWWLREAD